MSDASVLALAAGRWRRRSRGGVARLASLADASHQQTTSKLIGKRKPGQLLSCPRPQLFLSLSSNQRLCFLRAAGRRSSACPTGTAGNSGVLLEGIGDKATET